MHNKNQQNEGLMPDSALHIARLESKLKKIKDSNTSTKITFKDLMFSMKEFNQIYMHDFLKNGQQSQVSEENSIVFENLNRSYLERKLLPEQPITTEETQCLIENDMLSKIISNDQNNS